MKTISQYFLTAIRILIGWHFLYEGLAKLFSKSWSSVAYLTESHWIFSGLFHSIAANETSLKVVDFLNIWGLILIGLGLFLGVLTRYAGIAGALLMLLYYVANPPLIGFASEASGEGQYLIVNKNLIEMAVLALFAFLPTSFTFSIDRLIGRLASKFRSADAAKSPEQEEVSSDTGRRELLKDLISLPLLGGFVYAALSKRKWESFEERHLISEPSRVDAVSGASPKGISFASLSELEGAVPKGKIGKWEISRYSPRRI